MTSSYQIKYPVFFIHLGKPEEQLKAAGTTCEDNKIVWVFTDFERARAFIEISGKGKAVAVNDLPQFKEILKRGSPTVVSFDPKFEGKELISKNHVEVSTILGTPSDPLPQGVVDFYSAQAELMLAQYENINQLLGPTTDWTGPGTHCEVLLRDFLRRCLLSWMSVDKGYIFGRTPREGAKKHSPEIDILIHDTHNYRPLFRLDDFVIVQPEAVLGIIQVKRCLDSSQLKKGIENVVAAKRHFINMQRAKDPNGRLEFQRFLFSAVVSFEDRLEKNPKFYKKRLVESLNQQIKDFSHLDGQFPKGFVLPNFIGSLQECFLLTDLHSMPLNGQDYSMYESHHDGRNVALQAFLFALTSMTWGLSTKPPFVFPRDMQAIHQFSVKAG